MKRHQQFSLAALMLGTTCVAVAFAVIPYPFVTYYLLLTLFFFAAIISLVGPHESRSFWWWFALCGWLYVFLGISLLEWIERTSWWSSIHAYLKRSNPSLDDWDSSHYLILAHSIIALATAISGGILVPTIARYIDDCRPYENKGKLADANQKPRP